MLLVCYSKGWEDYLQWQQEDKKVVRRINALIADALRHPTEGIGKPECLKHQLSGAWSRRITQEHRLVYLFDQEKLVIVSCRLHYET